MSTAAEEGRLDILEKMQAKPVRKRRRVCGEKVCQVCGDKALAHHFGTLTCETCKAFFRRNALLKEQRKCLFEANCPITIKTRRFCPACRLAKCFNVGMRVDLIQDEEEKKERKQKMTHRKLRKMELQQEQSLHHGKITNTVSSPACSVTTTGHDTPNSSEQCSSVLEQAWHTASEMNSDESLTVNIPGTQSADGKWIQELPLTSGQNIEIMMPNPDSMAAGQESKLMLSGRETFLPFSSSEFSYPSALATPAFSNDCSQEILQQPVYASISPTPQLQDHGAASSLSSSPVPPSHFRPFQHVPREALPSDPYMYWRLSEEERCLLTHLSAAYQDTVLAVLNENPPKEVISNNLITRELFLEESEIIARQVVSFAKRMEDFRQLHMDEQIALLKASTGQVLGIRACALLILEKNAWLTLKGYFTMEQSRMLFPENPAHDLSINFFRTVKGIVKNDVTLYALLHCLILFDPSDERVLDRQLINSIRDKYFILLRHYLESVYSYTHSEKYMMALQENIIAYRSLCQEGKAFMKRYFLFISNKLLLEVLDLE